MFRNMVTSLFKYDRIKTTDTKAKELRRWADKLITLAKKGDLHARRRALSIVQEKNVVHKLFEEAAERFGAISGGYTRIIKIGRRPGDAAPISLIELIEPESKDKKKKAAKKAKPAKTKKVGKKEAPAAAAAEAPKIAEGQDAAQTVPSEAAVEDHPEKSEEKGVAQETASQENIQTDGADANVDTQDASTEAQKAEAAMDDVKKESGAQETGDAAEKKEEK
jgi:large subunit ribosomal protein L17